MTDTGSIQAISGKTWKEVSRQAVCFAIACRDMNDIDDLSKPHAPKDADLGDCEEWDISPSEWSWAIETARVAMSKDASIEDSGEIYWGEES